MNYIILNDIEYYKNKIDIDNFKEVSLHGKDRVDGVFGTITQELLDGTHPQYDSESGNRFFEEEWICRDRGVQFVVIRIPQNILYSENRKSIKECFELFDKESFFVELWSSKLKNKEKYEYFLIGYNKNFDFKILFDEEFYEFEENNIVKYLCEKIEENLFKA